MDSDFLKKFIDSQGWSLFGITSFEKIKKNLERHENIFEEWVSHHYQADMNWLERMEKDRFHPERVLAEVKSVIVLGAVYSRDSGNRTQDSADGLIARYARGKDYHNVLKKKLIELSAFLKSKKPEAETYLSVDSGPTADRVLAESAGLGFFGKNTCLINPPRGSYFFIASLMTTLDLPVMPEKPMPDCGECRKCIENCPTSALTKPGQLDARQCISYLTIENKGAIPVELRPKIGNRLFGCDACQECCPFNAVSRSGVLIDALKPENGAGELLDLKTIFSIDSDEEFLSRFAGTPLMRAKRRGLLRNACVVAGNSGDKTFIPFLEELINREKDDIILDHARWAVNQLTNGTEG